MTADRMQCCALVVCRQPLPAGKTAMGPHVQATPHCSICSRRVSLHRSRQGGGSEAAGSPCTPDHQVRFISWTHIHRSSQQHHRQQTTMPAWAAGPGGQVETARKARGSSAVQGQAQTHCRVPHRQQPASAARCSWHPGEYLPSSCSICVYAWSFVLHAK